MCFVGLIRIKEHKLGGAILLESEDDVDLRGGEWKVKSIKNKAKGVFLSNFNLNTLQL